MVVLDRPGDSRHAVVDSDEVSSRDVVCIPVGTSLEDACRTLILATLERCGGVRKQAAGLLGISLKTLYNKLVAYREQEQGEPEEDATASPRDPVDEASDESFPASDPPARNPTRVGPPRRDNGR